MRRVSTGSTLAGALVCALAFAVSSGPATADEGAVSPDAHAEAERLIRNAFEAWTLGLAEPDGIVYDGPWRVSTLDDGIAFSVPALSFPFTDVALIEITAQEVIYRPAGPDSYRLIWPTQDVTATLTYELFDQRFVRAYTGMSMSLDMAPGHTIPRRLVGHAASMTVTPPSEWYVATSLEDGRIAATFSPNDDGTYDLIYVSGARSLTDSDMFGSFHIAAMSAVDRVDRLDLDVVRDVIAAFTPWIEYVQGPLGPPPRDMERSFADMFATLPDLVDSIASTAKFDRMSMTYNRMEEIGAASMVTEIVFSGLSGNNAGARVALWVDGFSSDHDDVRAAVPESMTLTANTAGVPLADVWRTVGEQMSTPGDGGVMLDRVLAVFDDADSGLIIDDLTLAYDDWTVRVEGEAAVIASAMFGASVGLDIVIDHPDRIAPRFADAEASDEAIALVDELIALGEPSGDGAETRLYRLRLSPIGEFTINDQDVFALLTALFFDLLPLYRN